MDHISITSALTSYRANRKRYPDRDRGPLQLQRGLGRKNPRFSHLTSDCQHVSYLDMADKRPFLVSIRGLDRELWKRVKDYCWAKSMTLRRFIEEAIEERLKK